MNYTFSFRAEKFRLTVCLIVSATIFVTSSCKIQRVPPGNFEYFKSKSKSYPAYIANQEPQVTLIEKDDILGIMLSSLNAESNEAINYTNTISLPVTVFSGKAGGGGQSVGYVVDSLGYVNIPFVGKLPLVGLSLQKAEELVTAELIKKIKAPVVNIRFMNHKFSVLGEVGSIGTFNLFDDKTTLLDAITLAGDLSVYAKRDSVVIIRNAENMREINIINLRDRSVFLSPYFYLKNNDIIYVAPNNLKFIPERPFKQSPPPPLAFQRLSLLVGLVSVLTLLANFYYYY